MLKTESKTSIKTKLLILAIMFTNSNLFSYDEGIAKSGNIEIYYRDYGPAAVSYTHLTLPTSG